MLLRKVLACCENAVRRLLTEAFPSQEVAVASFIFIQHQVATGAAPHNVPTDGALALTLDQGPHLPIAPAIASVSILWDGEHECPEPSRDSGPRRIPPPPERGRPRRLALAQADDQAPCVSTRRPARA